MIYRVVLKVGYYKAWFDFENSEEASVFMTTALVHSVESEDSRKMAKVTLELIDPTVKEEED